MTKYEQDYKNDAMGMHYEEYPYPYRNHKEAQQQSCAVVGEYLGELNHWLFKGKETFNQGFRVLIAGGGTGDSTLFLAEQLKNYPAEIVYLDITKASLEIARKRTEAKGLTNITWVNNSIFNVPHLHLGKFDYISCSGVLHHLKDPIQALEILKNSLKEQGAMAIMVYAKYGRTGLYQFQDILRLVNQGETDKKTELENGKKMLQSLPETNWFMKAKDLLQDHILFGDGGFYDQFLHKHDSLDRAYSVSQIYELLEQAGLHFVDFYVPSERIDLLVDKYVKDPSLLQKIKKMETKKQQLIAELITGNIINHYFYAAKEPCSIASVEDVNNVPYFYARNLGTARHLYEFIEKQAAWGHKTIDLNLSNLSMKDAAICLPLSKYTKYILQNMISESKSLQEIFEAVRQELQQNVPNEVLIKDAKLFFEPLFQTGTLLLRDRSIHPFKVFW